MKKQNKRRTLAGLTLGLCLVAAQALAWSHRAINSSGSPIQAKCSQNSSYDDIANGALEDYFCGDNNLSVQAAGSSSVYNITDDCASTEFKSTTVTAGASAGALNLAHQCLDEESHF